MKKLNIKENKSFSKFLIIIFSLIPISIIAGNAVMEVNFLLIIISFLYFVFLNRSSIEEIRKDNFIYLLLILWVYLILNSFFGVDFLNSIKRNFLFFKFILIIISFKYLLTKYDILKKIIFYWTIVIMIVSLDVFFEFAFGFNMLGFESPMKNERIISFFKDELIVGCFLFSFLFIIIFSSLRDNKVKIAFSIGLIVSLAIILSGERSIVLKLIFSYLILIFFVQKNLKIKLFSLGLFVSMFFILLNIDVFKQRYIDQIKKDLNFGNQDFKHNLLQTKYLNQSVFSYEILKNKPFFGVGNKNYHKECINLKNTSKDKSIKVMTIHCYTHPHQVYYEFIAEHGIFGTLIILIIFYKLLFSNQKFKFPENQKKLIIILKIYCLSSFLPIVPTGSFFSSFQLILFFINYSFYQIYISKLKSSSENR